MKKTTATILLIIIGAAGLPSAKAQNSWDYSWGYSTTMRYYSNKAAMKKAVGGPGNEKPAKHKPYVMYPHAGKSTFDNNQEKVSDFKLQNIAIDILKDVDWEKEGAKDQWQAYRMRDTAIKKLMDGFKGAIRWHNEWLTAKKLPVNDLAVTWALGIAACEGLKSGGPNGERLKAMITQCRQHLADNGAVNKNNYEKSIDQIRLIALGVRPYVQYNEAAKSGNVALQKGAGDAAVNFLTEYRPGN